MREYFKDIRKHPVRFLPFAVCAMIITAALSIYMTIYNNNEMGKRTSEITSEMETLEWRMLSDIIVKGNTRAKQDAKIYALDIEYSIRSQYPNMLELQNEFKRGEYTKKFNSILKGVLDQGNKDNFITLVGTEDYLITKFANTKNLLFSELDVEGTVSWEQVISMTPNQDLTKAAIEAVVNKSTDVIFTLDKNSKSGSVANSTKAISLDSLKKIYTSDGIEGLYNVSILAPAYITDTGDIFGIDDTTFLKNNKNHKLIVIRIINLKSLIDENRDIIDRTTDTLTDLYDTTVDQGGRNLLQSVLWTFIFFLLSLVLIAVYNKESCNGNLKKD